MDSSFDMLNRSSYFPISPYPLSFSSDMSSSTSASTRSNNYAASSDYSACFVDEASSYPPTVYPSPSSHSAMIHFNATIGDASSADRYKSSYCLPSLSARTDRCLVCNDRASGIHFGVSTCEACKAFFRRTSLSSYSIARACSPLRCEINVKNRNNCPSCRFDKCKRLGMDRDNVIYGKPSRHQSQPTYQQAQLIQQLQHLSDELIEVFQVVRSLHETSPFNSFETRQQMEKFAGITCQLFYRETPEIQISHSSELVHRIFSLIFDSCRNDFIADYDATHRVNLRVILSLWLFVYYCETFLLKRKISPERLTVLIKLLDMELVKSSRCFEQDQQKQKFLRVHFVNSFTIFADHLQDIYSAK